MSNYYARGGLRIKCKGRASKTELLEAIAGVLDELEGRLGVREFSGINLYTQLYDEGGDRLLLQTSEGSEVSVVIVDPGAQSMLLTGIGIKTEKVRVIDRREKADKENEEVSRREYRQRILAKEKEKEEADRDLESLKATLCQEFGVENFHEIGSSVGKIVAPHAISKYLSVNDIPEEGFVYRASLRDPVSRKVSRIRIYSPRLELLTDVIV